MSLTRIILFSRSKNTGYGLERVYIPRPIWYNKIRRFVLHRTPKVHFIANVIVSTRNNHRTFPCAERFLIPERRVKTRRHIHNEDYDARRNYNGARREGSSSTALFMSANRYWKIKPSMRFYWFQIVRVLGFVHMGNRVVTAGVSAAYTSKLIQDISITRTEKAGNKNIMRDKRVKAYSNSRPVLLTFISTVALHSPRAHCVSIHLRKRLTALTVRWQILSLDRSPNSGNRLQSLPSERRSFFLFFESTVNESNVLVCSVRRVVITYYTSWNQNLWIRLNALVRTGFILKPLYVM